jgi:hypothetical protein
MLSAIGSAVRSGTASRDVGLNRDRGDFLIFGMASAVLLTGERPMTSIIVNLRVAVVAGLITSLSAGNFCPCAADGVSGRMGRHASHASHVCTCVLKTGHCRCGAACHCGQKLPQKGSDPAAPNSSNDRSQPVGLAADFAASSQATFVAFHAHFDLNPLSKSNLTLIAQGTRLNV